MVRRVVTLVLLAALALLAAGCSNKKVKNPIAGIDSKQPDKVLFDRAMEAMKRNKFDVARLTLQTLINTYPDSEYIARAKLSVGDSWYAEGGSAALAQAEIEYKDFITFFPNMAEAAEAQLKVANIHYQQMEKPDRDFTHAKRAEEEYKQLLLQFPDHELAEDAKLRLLEVQEVLAEREYRVGRFYHLRESWAAAIARLKSLVETYPLYSQVDEALYLLGDAYEEQIELARASALQEAAKGRVIQELTKEAADAYSRILTRYPAMRRAEDARARLQALRRPVPEPTEEALARNQAEEASRVERGRFAKLMLNFRKRPDVARAVKVGEPTMDEPKQISAMDVARQTTRAMIGEAPSGQVTVETVGSGEPPKSDPVPRSESGQPPAPDLQTLPPVNDAQTDEDENAAAQQNSGEKKDEKSTSSSKKKKKKGLRKLIPF